MASAARQAGFTGEHLKYTDELKPVLPRTEASSHDYSYPPYSTLPSATQVKHEVVDDYSFLAFTPSHITPASSSSSLPSSTSHPTPAPQNATTADSYSCPVPLSQVQLPPLLNIRPEYSPPNWVYSATYESNRGHPADHFYERERNKLINFPRFAHRASLPAVRFSETYVTHTPEYVHPFNEYYPALDELRYNECCSNPPRLIYPQAIYPGTAISPYSRPAQHATAGTERPFLCEKCGARFNRNHDLKRHTRIHLEVKPFPCGWCDKAFSRKDALKRHLIVKVCSGTTEVSVEESIRRAEQLRQRKSKNSSLYTLGAPSVPKSEVCPRKIQPLPDIWQESTFNFSISGPHPVQFS